MNRHRTGGGILGHYRPPTDLRTDVPHSARVYDCWLGGKDNFAADRLLAEQIRQIVPSVPLMARANREFIHRVVKYLAGEAGIRQFLDIGTGIPTEPNLHEVAQQVDPTCRVVYVDNDPLVLVHARALLTSDTRGACAYLQADLRHPDAILRSAEVTGTLDLTRPVAVTLAAVLMLLPSHAQPWRIVRTLRERLPAGSYLAISHPTGDFNQADMDAAVATANQAGFTFVPRPRSKVARFFDGWDLVEPGVVPLLAWRPDGQPPDDPHDAYFWAGVARKPRPRRQGRHPRPP